MKYLILWMALSSYAFAEEITPQHCEDLGKNYVKKHERRSVRRNKETKRLDLIVREVGASCRNKRATLAEYFAQEGIKDPKN